MLLQGRSAQECKNRFTVVLDPELVKGAWTKEEDERVSIVWGIYQSWTKGHGFVSLALYLNCMALIVWHSLLLCLSDRHHCTTCMEHSWLSSLFS